MNSGFKRVLIANRGEIACRAIQTLKKMQLVSLAVYAPADAQSLHVARADEALALDGTTARQTYLDPEKILNAAKALRAQAIFPGYGFLSENAEFARACEAQGLVFIGPTPEQIRAFGLKHEARELAQRAGVPLLPGSGLLSDLAAARAAAEQLGYPVMLKSTAGGGGIGLSVCHDKEQLSEAFERGVNLGKSNFGDGGVFLEKFVARARHIEVQVFGDGRGTVIALGERDCSVQRRNQKLIEETPALGLKPELRSALSRHATELLQQLAYRSAGTVEFVYDTDAEQAYFLEVNTRLQVEHTVTERVTGVDLVQWMVDTARGTPPDLANYIHAPLGHAIEARIYAESPAQNFRPSSGLITHTTFPETISSIRPPTGSIPPPSRDSARPSQRPATVRVDTWIEAGVEVTTLFDPLLAKITVWGPTRAEAVQRLGIALEQTFIDGIDTNLGPLLDWTLDPDFARGSITTNWLAERPARQTGIEVIEPGRFSSVQDFPGRVGYWKVGIPPSGPMDSLALRLGNRVVGNPEGTSALEMTSLGATLRFHSAAVICLSGADMQARLDGAVIGRYRPVTVQAGQVLQLGEVAGPGARAYLCILGGIDVPDYLGSRSTFTLGRFGGHGGRVLHKGDVLYAGSTEAVSQAGALPEALVPNLTHEMQIRVMRGPHAAPDFFTEKDIATFFETSWEVHYNSARTGVRLLGPKPEWARPDGGEAGLHPSNIHDCAYAFGAIDYTGDMPIVLGPDGPSLGGFVCPAVVIHADLWKLGQLAPGQRVRFEPVTAATAAALEHAQDTEVRLLTSSVERLAAERTIESSALSVQDVRLHTVPASAVSPEVCYRPAGDKFLLVEYGPMTLDLNLRFRVRALAQWLEQAKQDGILETTEGVRSLQVHFDSQRLRVEDLLALLIQAEKELDGSSQRLPSRVVHLPLSWDDPATRLAIQKYDQGVRKNAPWAPSNIEFIRRINGLQSVDEVRRIVYDASYLVLGLGDVYLGAPVATPLDPRHRLVTTKYNPARTWTPENAVGIGGAYLCVYGMEGPGGYQFVGRTLQMFNRFRVTKDFEPGHPWLLRPFDQLRFYPVEAKELMDMREAFQAGRLELQIEHKMFDLAEYNHFLEDIAESTDSFKAQQRAAFEAERQHWVETGQLQFSAEEPEPNLEQHALPAGCTGVNAPVPGSVWRVEVVAGQAVVAGQRLLVLESMKMEVAVEAPHAGHVQELLVAEGAAVVLGQPLVALRASAIVSDSELDDSAHDAQSDTTTHGDPSETLSTFNVLGSTLHINTPAAATDESDTTHTLSALDVANTGDAAWAVTQLLADDFTLRSDESSPLPALQGASDPALQDASDAASPHEAQVASEPPPPPPSAEDPFLESERSAATDALAPEEPLTEDPATEDPAQQNVDPPPPSLPPASGGSSKRNGKKRNRKGR